MKKEEIFDARTLACYVIEKYKEYTNGKIISNIKLQKSLYFLLAYWGGFVRKGQTIQSEEKIESSEILFSNKIEAWVYGPVVPEVFNARRNGNLNDYDDKEKIKKIFDNTVLLEETINSLLIDIFQVADFKLVSTSHDDKSWSNHFDMSSQYHNEVIPQNEIIEEYALRNAI